ncbi:hypothetical protein ACTXT7_003474 [Hymenolepis weldensis]
MLAAIFRQKHIKVAHKVAGTRYTNFAWAMAMRNVVESRCESTCLSTVHQGQPRGGGGGAL